MKNKTPAELMLEELRIIPKLIIELKNDIETVRGAVLASPKWSDMKVVGGIRQSQEDKNITIVDTTDYNVKQIKELIARREEIKELVFSLPDMLQRHVLLTTYLNCQTFDEAMDKLEMTRKNYFMLKRKGVESLNLILKDTKRYSKILKDTQRYSKILKDTQKY